MANIITRAMVDAYGDALQALDRQTYDAVYATIRQALVAWLERHPDPRPDDYPEFRELAIRVAQAAATQGASDAEGVSMAVTDLIREQSGAPPRPAPQPYEVDPAAIEGTVRRQINLVRDGQYDEFAQAMGRLASKHVKRAARSAMLGNGGVRFQRVPQGEKTCTFCQMLASCGPVYYSRESALYKKDSFDRFHGGCDCEVIEVPPGFAIEGFDQKYERDKWQAFERIDADNDHYPDAEAKNAAKLAYDSEHGR